MGIVYKVEDIFISKSFICENQINRLTINYKSEKNNFYSFLKQHQNEKIIFDLVNIYVDNISSALLLDTIIKITEKVENEIGRKIDIEIFNSKDDVVYNKKLKNRNNIVDTKLENVNDFLYDIDSYFKEIEK